MAVALLYWLALFVGTHTPQPAVATHGQGDKVLHFAAYGVLGLLLGMTVAVARPMTWRVLGILMLCLAVVAAGDELLQIPIPSRHGDAWDWTADCLGGALGLLLVMGGQGWARVRN